MSERDEMLRQLVSMIQTQSPRETAAFIVDTVDQIKSRIADTFAWQQMPQKVAKHHGRIEAFVEIEKALDTCNRSKLRRLLMKRVAEELASGDEWIALMKAST